MENASRGLAAEALRRLPSGGRVLIVCGGGNNGGERFENEFAWNVIAADQFDPDIHVRIGNQEDHEFGDLLSGEHEQPAHEHALQNMLHERLRNLLDSRLNWREREIIKLRFGLGDGYNYTLEEVAYIFKVTRERIRQLEDRALRKLQDPRCSGELVGFID